MFPSQMVRLKIVFLSNGPLYPCFPRKWYALKLFSFKWSILSMFPSKWYSSQMVHFMVRMFPSHKWVRLKIVFLSNGPILSMFPSNGPLKWFHPCFPRKWYALKLFSSQIVHFIHVSLANGTP